MKALKITILFIIISQLVSAQVIFNEIIEDTINHITNSVVATDTSYIILTGTGNEHGVRSYAFTSVDLSGNRQWKKIYGDSQYQNWEGWDNNLNQFANKYSLCGAYVNTDNSYRGIHLTIFDSAFNISTQSNFLYDAHWIQAFGHIKASDNKFYITGQIDTAGDQDRLLIIKTDNNGNYLWHKALGSNVYEYGGCILETSDKSIITAGASWITHSSNTRWYIVNTDTAGNVIWERYYGRENFNNGYAKDLLETHDSKILICGSYPAAGYGSGDEEIIWDGCLRKIDQNGELIWEKLYRNYSKIESPDMIHLESSLNVIIYKNNDIYLLGNNRDHRGASRGYLQKVTDSGDICWQRNYYAIDTNSTYQWLVSVQNTSDGGFIMTGYGNTYNTHGYDPPQQAWLVKTDSLGMDGLCNIEPDALNIDIDIPVLPEGFCMNDTLEVYVHIAGKSAPYTVEFSTGQVIDSIFYPPCFVPVEIGLTDINLTWAGETYFEESITEATLSNHEWGQCIAKPVEFYTPTTWGPQTLYITVTDAYGETKTITKEIFAVECSTYNDISDQSELKIYPNPVKDVLNIEVPRDCDFNNAEIYDSKGQIINHSEFSGSVFSIDTRNFKSGTYVIKLSDSKGNIRSEYFEKIE